MFQSLSGLTLGLNWGQILQTRKPLTVSIPFRADTGFEQILLKSGCDLEDWKFQSLSGLTLGLNRSVRLVNLRLSPHVSIPFRADTGFEHDCRGCCRPQPMSFQSLSGLTLGLNKNLVLFLAALVLCFNPFQG